MLQTASPTHLAESGSPVVICGAGIAGIAAAWFLSVRHGLRNVLLVDERRPLTLTSDKSTEAYRNWWPGPDDAMLRFMNRSVDLLEEFAGRSGNGFHLNRRGYFYATARPEHAAALRRIAQETCAMGAGELRIHDDPRHDAYTPAPFAGYQGQPDGADLLLGREMVQRHFPWMAQDIVAVLHVRRCGWFSGQQLGMLLLDEARGHGVTFVNGRVTAVEQAGGRVTAVRILRDGNEELQPCRAFVNAAGPLARRVAALCGVDLPLFSERHLKIAFDDKLGALPRSTGLVICEDPICLEWSDEERAELAAAEATRWLTQPIAGGAHARPEGHSAESQTVLVLWAFHTAPHPEFFPVPLDPDFSEVALRGISRLIPAMKPYCERLPKVYMDGGYYTKTAENRPIIGPTPVDGAFVIAGLSGYGLMAACAAGELLAAHVAGAPLPGYAPAFLLSRYDDPAYQTKLRAWGDTSQL